MGQVVSKAPDGEAQQAPQQAREAHHAMYLYQLCWHGSPECQDADALAVPAVPLYDSDDETTDSAVISALAMTDPADLSRRRHRPADLDRAHSAGQRPIHAPILQSLTQHTILSRQPSTDPIAALPKLPSPPQQQAQHTLAGAVVAAAAAAAGNTQLASKHTHNTSASSQLRRPRYKDTTMTAAAAAAAVTAAAAATAGRQQSSMRNRFAAQAPKSAQQQQQPDRYQDKFVVPLSAAALDAVGAPCRIGADLPPESLRSVRGSGADVVGVKPYHHLRMMQMHRQHQQHQQQKQQLQQAMCAQAQAVWGWQAASTGATQVAT